MSETLLPPSIREAVLAKAARLNAEVVVTLSPSGEVQITYRIRSRYDDHGGCTRFGYVDDGFESIGPDQRRRKKYTHSDE